MVQLPTRCCLFGKKKCAKKGMAPKAEANFVFVFACILASCKLQCFVVADVGPVHWLGLDDIFC